MNRERGHKPETEIEITPDTMIGFVRFSQLNLDLIGLKKIALKYTCRSLTQEEKDTILTMLKTLESRLAFNPLQKTELEEVHYLLVNKFKLAPEAAN